MIISFFLDLIIRNEQFKRNTFRAFTSLASKITLKILGIHVHVKNMPKHEDLKKVLVVSNHLSYLDIINISSLFPSLYITSVEVERTFFLGFMAKMGGSLFVERRSKSKLLEEIDRIAGVLRSGNTITLFPEGTSSNGDTVLPFKGALFSTAEKARIPIQPICVKYTSIAGKPVTANNRDFVYYYGDHYFFPHLSKLFLVNDIQVTITFLPQIDIAASDRKDLVAQVHSVILNTYHSIS
jgi:1-acyl-sn-glycerol-3-phosphate acyltransferase